MKKFLLLTLLSASVTPCHAAILIAYTSFGNSPDTTPTLAETGFTASLTQDLSAETSGGSTDQTWGTLSLSPAPATNDGYARVTSAMTITVTNGSLFIWQLDSLHFDSVSNQGSPAGSPFTVTYAIDGGSSVSLGSGTAAYVAGLTSGSASDYGTDSDFAFTAATLLPGKSIVITIDPSLSMRVDNLLLTGTIIPEPAFALLASFGIIPLLRRRDR